MAVIGDLVARLTADTRGFDKNLTRSRTTLGDFVKGIGSIPLTTAAAIGGAVASFRSMASGVISAVAAAADAERQEKKLAAVIASTGGAAGLSVGQIADYAAELQTLTNFEADATVGAASLLATFTNIKGDVFKEALASAQDLSTVFETDLKSSVVQLGKALNDPAKGLTALSRSGVSFTAQQKAQIQTLQKSGDLLGAQKIILAELAKEVGGAARATADPMTQLGNVVGDLGENVGAVLLPSVREIASGLMRAIAPANSATGTFKGLGEALGTLTREAIAPLVDLLTTAGQKAVEFANLAAFGFRNFGEVAEIALTDAQLAIFDFIPGAEGAFEQIGAALVGVWDAAMVAVRSGWQTTADFIAASSLDLESTFEKTLGWWDRFKASVGEFQDAHPGIFDTRHIGETAEQAKARREAERAALRNRAANREAKAAALGGQADILSQRSGGMFADMLKQFRETRNAALEGFKGGGGLRAMLEERKRALAEAVAAREGGLGGKADGGFRAGVAGAAGGLMVRVATLAGAMERFGTDAQSVINRNTAGGRVAPEDETAKNTAKTAAAAEKLVVEMRNLARGSRPVVFTV